MSKIGLVLISEKRRIVTRVFEFVMVRLVCIVELVSVTTWQRRDLVWRARAFRQRLCVTGFRLIVR